MATTFQAIGLSGSVSGRPIPVAAIATPGTLIHTVDATALDEIYLYANNTTAAAAKITVEWGGVATGDHIVDTLEIPANSGPVQLTFGQRLTGGLAVRAYGSVASAINITGVVNRISTT